MNNKHHFSVLLVSRPAGRLLHIDSADRRVCFIYYNKNSFILASHGVFLRHLTFKYSQNCVRHGCGYDGKLSELRKDGSRKEKSNISSFIVRGYPQVPVGWALRARHRTHVDNPREGGTCISVWVVKLTVIRFICWQSCHFLLDKWGNKMSG